jgi:hypothetical protein
MRLSLQKALPHAGESLCREGRCQLFKRGHDSVYIPSRATALDMCQEALWSTDCTTFVHRVQTEFIAWKDYGARGHLN